MTKALLVLVTGLLTGAGVYYVKLAREHAPAASAGACAARGACCAGTGDCGATSSCEAQYVDVGSCGDACGLGVCELPLSVEEEPIASRELQVALRKAVDQPAPVSPPDSTPEPVRLGEGELLTGVPGDGPLTADEVRAWLADERNHRELAPRLPLGLDEGTADVRGLDANPLTRAKIELGRQLFFDPRFSADGSVSCSSCHDPRHGYATPDRFAVGIGGQLGSRNSPTAANRIVSEAQFWDGRAVSLEAQAIDPMANPAEMGFTHAAVVDLLESVEGYRVQFQRVFGGDGSAVTIENAGRAIAAFERAVVTGPSAWDLHNRVRRFEAAYADELAEAEFADPDLLDELDELERAAAARPLSEPATRGAELFFSDRARCTQCHVGANFSDERYHNLGVAMGDQQSATDWGRFTVTGAERDRGAFKTPGLRSVAETAPYMHDGSLATLADVVAWYVQGGRENPHLSPLVEPLDLDDEEQADLVAFLEALSGDWPAVETGRLPE